MNTASKDIGLIVLAIVIFVVSFMALGRVDKIIRIKAMDDCARAYRYEATVEGGNAKVSYTLGDEYKACLKEKGF